MEQIRLMLVNKLTDDNEFIECSSMLAGVDGLTKTDIIKASGFDPYEPFRKYEVMRTDLIPFESYFKYGGSSNDIIIDTEQCDEIYNKRFKGEIDEKNRENTGNNGISTEDMDEVS